MGTSQSRSQLIGGNPRLIQRFISAAYRGHIQDVEQLLGAPGIHVNAKDKYGDTALSMAAEGGKLAIVELLLEAGADVNAKNEDGNTALMWAAGEFGHTDIVGRLLGVPGIHVNAKNKHGFTALKLAAGDGWTAIVELLLNAGADVNAKDNDGETALMSAARNGKLAIVERLLAVPGIDVNAKHKDGRTALMMADNAEIARAIARAIRKRPRELHWVVSESKRQKYDIVDGVAAMMNLG